MSIEAQRMNEQKNVWKREHENKTKEIDPQRRKRQKVR